jgi:hypothetical protein
MTAADAAGSAGGVAVRKANGGWAPVMTQPWAWSLSALMNSTVWL